MSEWPWADLKVGDGFFVACLDHDVVKKEGLREAALAGVNGVATPAIFKGLYGLWFIRIADRSRVFAVPKRSPPSGSPRRARASRRV